MNKKVIAVLPALVLALSAFFPAASWGEADPHHWCNAPGSHEGDPAHRSKRCGDDDAHCHRGSECRNYPPFRDPNGSYPNDGAPESDGRNGPGTPARGAHSAKECHDQGCRRHCDHDGCWPDEDQSKRPHGEGEG